MKNRALFSGAFFLLLLAPNKINIGTQTNGLGFQLNGIVIGSEAAYNFQNTGSGIIAVCSDDPNNKRVNCSYNYNSALIPTFNQLHMNPDFCRSSNGTLNYTCNASFGAPVTAYSDGMRFDVVVDKAPLPPTSSCLLNVNNVGLVNIKQADGSTDPTPAMIVVGQMFKVWYDGTKKVFRIYG